ncbi:MAG TPA: hypothetical protein VK543_12615 [Puia sp.]|nr:hypothetical protein [Puia sp.]
MLSIELTINVLVLALIVIIAALAGFSLRGRQIAKSRSRIEQLEREILNNYAEILTLEKENTGMESKLQDFQSPVIQIKTAIKDETLEGEKFPDVSLRKKLLSKENLLKQSASGK